MTDEQNVLRFAAHSKAEGDSADQLKVFVCLASQSEQVVVLF